MITQRISKLQASLFVIAFLIFTSLMAGISLHAQWIHIFDQTIINFIRQFSPSKTAFFKAYTVFFNTLPIMLVVVVGVAVLFLYKFYRIGFFFLLIPLVGSVINVGIKDIIDRSRPQVNQLIHYGGYSFPSGHSTIAALVFGSIILLVQRLSLPRYIKWILIFILLFAILLVGISRIYIGVHYPSDVLAGFCLGFMVITLGQFIFKIKKA
ncbi:membrane-associated phospholipid phosphatase [Paucilactobacillus oligofermentans DSM 15707 = LMG 22743]|uniref:Membrane-associated phospholipid phosphatase n=1 Tax=Paucilactobacillus oligofermentans DSM 15707 = LMG 22743 TaxID=1423778 RepID=A0A0R1RGQ1_9LACO|nr:phosphatase PAP2 family protein [Paucilactobacillus oligofermentans]KRL56055.1 membrane-associated phospholipid phosphatase [Paucilactobacillus oligofermentans DSM 15707 = LMG 22743]CUS25961.1 Putative membrane-associated phospholipid phosphatase [Paucilactobacillus oligofermentans DSM 15707 = LMG 22743]